MVTTLAPAPGPIGPVRVAPPARRWPAPDPRPLHTVTLAALMAPPDAPPEMSEQWERRVAEGWREMEAAARGMDLRGRAVPSDVPGYAIAQCLNVVAAFEASTGELAGGILSGNLHVVAGHQGRGLGAAIVRLAFETGVKDIDHHVLLSPGGRATRRAAHRRAVEIALRDGLEVAPEVLADYPDLAGEPVEMAPTPA